MTSARERGGETAMTQAIPQLRFFYSFKDDPMMPSQHIARNIGAQLGSDEMEVTGVILYGENGWLGQILGILR